MFSGFLFNSIIILVSANNATVSIVDSNPFLKDFVAIYVPIYSALIGATAAFVLILAHERSREQKEIKKIRSLLNSDFSEMYRLITKDKEFFQNAYDKLDKEDGLVNQLVSGKLVVIDFYHKYGIFYDFEFWNAVVSSGSLLKLKQDEISDVQAVHNSFSWYNANVLELQDGTTDYLVECLSDEDPENELDLEEIKENLTEYFKSLLTLMQDCIDDL